MKKLTLFLSLILTLALAGTGWCATNLLTSWTNGTYTTFTASGANVTNAVWGSGTQTAHSNTITTVSGQVYLIEVNLTVVGQAPTLSGTNGFPTKALAAGNNSFGWTATGTSCVITATNTAISAWSSATSIVYQDTFMGLGLGMGMGLGGFPGWQHRPTQ